MYDYTEAAIVSHTQIHRNGVQAMDQIADLELFHKSTNIEWEWIVENIPLDI